MNQFVDIIILYTICGQKIDYSNLNFENDKTDFISSLNEVVSQNMTKITSIKEKFNSISNLHFDGISNKLTSCIDNYMNKLDSFQNCFTDGKELTDEEKKNVQNLIEEINKLEEQLNSIVNESLNNFKKFISDNLKSEKIKLDDLTVLMSVLNISDEQKNAIKDTISEYKNDNKKNDKDEKGNKTDTEQQSVKEEKEENKYDIEFIAGEDYHKRVQDIRKQDRLSELEQQISEFQNIEKSRSLTFLEAMKYNSFQREKQELEKTSYAKKDLLAVLREKDLEILNDKKASYNEQINNEKSKQNNMKSKLFKFLSLKKIERLEKKINKLNEKFGTVKNAQSVSAIRSYNLKNQFISLKSNFATAKEEFGKIRSDYKKFVTKENIINGLKNKTGMILNKPKNLEINNTQNLNIVPGRTM